MRSNLKGNGRWLGCTAVLTLGLISTPCLAQSLLSRLRPPTATLAEEFTQISGVRELGDGRVIVTDAREVRIVVADLSSQRIEAVGRQGDGPGEYRAAYGLFAVGTDSTIVMDTRLRRWLVLVGGSIVATLPPDHPALIATQGGSRFASLRGQLAGMVVIPPPPGAQTIGPRDSAAIVLVELATGHADTVARMMRIQQTFVVWKDAVGGEHTMANRQAFATGEDFVIGADGWLAIARLSPYRVDWRSPDGRIVHGRPIATPPVRVTEREKAFYLERNAAAANRPFVMPPTAPGELRAGLEAGWKRIWSDFPETIPPFQILPLTPGPNGTLFVLRTPTADFPEPIYDIVNHAGALSARLQLAKGERIVGFGKASVYVAARDADDLDHLRRHPWP